MAYNSRRMSALVKLRLDRGGYRSSGPIQSDLAKVLNVNVVQNISGRDQLLRHEMETASLEQAVQRPCTVIVFMVCCCCFLRPSGKRTLLGVSELVPNNVWGVTDTDSTKIISEQKSN